MQMNLKIKFFPLIFSLVFFSPLRAEENSKTKDPVTKAPDFLEHKEFQDLLPSGPVLGFGEYKPADKNTKEFEKHNILQSSSFRRRYLERQWQQAHEEKNDTSLLEQSLLDQFGKKGFPKEMGSQPYHESPGRRYQIVFFISFPITALYAYGLFALPKAASGESTSSLSGAEVFGVLSLATVLSALIGWYDYSQEKSLPPNTIDIRLNK